MEKVFGYKVFLVNGVLLNDDMSKLRVQGKKNPVAFVNDDSGMMKRVKLEKLEAISSAESLGFVEIEGFDKTVMVNDSGDVFSRFKGSLLKPTVEKQSTGKTRLRLDLLKSDGRRIGTFVHRLVALAFLPNPLHKEEVNHKDGNPMNNNVSNLEWATKAENTKHAQENYLYVKSQKAVSAYSEPDILIGSYISMQEAADKLGMVSKNANKNISETCAKNASDKLNRGKSNIDNPFRSEGYIFKYA